MPDLATIFSFIAVSLVVLVLPGPGVLYVTARALSQGIPAGLVSALGLSVGVTAHVVAAAVGISAILMASATAFTIMKYVGAAYLIYLGIRTLLAGRSKAGTPTVSALPPSRLFLDGVIVSVFNPKIAVFFLAFLPQFVSPSAGPVHWQVILLGFLYAGLAFLTDGTYAVVAGLVKTAVGGRIARTRLPQYIGGSLLIGLGARTAMAEYR